MTLRYATDLITFADPRYWDVGDADGVTRLAAERPRWFWDRMVATVATAGVEAVEITFPPYDMSTAVAAYGSAAGVADAFIAAGCSVVSGFLPGSDWTEIPPSAAASAVAPLARFLAELGGSVIVIGTPMVHPGVDAVTATQHESLLDALAPALDAAGAVAAGLGVRLLVHTESHSITVTEPDIRGIMDRTDPALVGLCPDAAHITLSGGDPAAVVREHADRVWLAHWKDAAGPFPADLVILPGEDVHAVHRRYMRELGQGAVNWSAWADAMSTTPASDVRLLELDAAQDPAGSLARARAFAETFSH
jgi:inosose dehydratase